MVYKRPKTSRIAQKELEEKGYFWIPAEHLKGGYIWVSDSGILFDGTDMTFAQSTFNAHKIMIANKKG